jgi:tRNA(fMet)-specific endonuclease VapC
MTFLLDTDTCSAHVRRPAGLAHRFFQHAYQIAIPTIVVGELYAGAYKLPDPSRLRAKIDDLLVDLTILDYDMACAETFGKIRGELLRQGIAVPTTDLQIASVALVHDLTLVTHNTDDFRNIPGLRLDDWLAP